MGTTEFPVAELGTSRRHHAARPTGQKPCPAPPAASEQRHIAPRHPTLSRAAVRPADGDGIDDWAWRRNQRYGTIICDPERRKTIALLPDREPATAQAWLTEQQQIEIVAPTEVVVVMPMRQPERCRTRSKSPIGGT